MVRTFEETIDFANAHWAKTCTGGTEWNHMIKVGNSIEVYNVEGCMANIYRLLYRGIISKVGEIKVSITATEVFCLDYKVGSTVTEFVENFIIQDERIAVAK